MLDTAYIAGFFDGEGCIDIRYRRTNRGRYQRFELRLTISQVVRLPLDLIATDFGGSISARRNGNIHYYVITGAQAFILLTAIRPYLIVKADEADIAIRFYNIIKDGKPKRYVAGKKYLQKEAKEVIERKIECFNSIRAVRLAKGLSAKHRKEPKFIISA